ncbi:hypothetical protein NOR_03446 [Metarhizium rileyi]|uniref:DUF2421 domain-containing protein n=1 Tax=Metarhizium rileyi (strain RCEF 4871) TaxID=1649241 RepID=A0A167FRS3_METRR|nr:hypothetical protein NOR_03446 [Metarhizium rileyi RCEF 4871]
MTAATYSLVIGFSYDQYHIVQYGLPGIGNEALWKRLVTVLLDFAASCIVQVDPRAPSARNHKLCLAVNQSLRRLLDLPSSLPQEYQDRFINVVGFLDDHAIGDIMAVLGIVRLSLRLGAPLPEMLPAGFWFSEAREGV